MPKRVDPDERRREVADALLRVAARDGLAAVSLRHVAAEAGVTAGLLQHYFSSKDEMVAFAMHAASERYEDRFTTALAALGDDPAPLEVIRVVLQRLIPQSPEELDDARVALAFQSHAATGAARPAAISEGDAALRDFVAEQLERCAPSLEEPRALATAVLATGEGLGTAVAAGQVSVEDAMGAIEAQLRLIIAADPPATPRVDGARERP